MKFLTLTWQLSGPREWLRIRVTGFSVGIVFLLSLTVNQSSWAQLCQPNLRNANQNASVDVTDYPVRLNDVTLGNQITWAAQAFVAPERLEDLVPLYVYETDVSNVRNLLRNFEGLPEGANLHLGVAIHMRDEQGDQSETWRARPYDPYANGDGGVDIGDLFFFGADSGDGTATESSDSDSFCIVSSERLGDVPAVERLWIPEADWQDGLAQNRNHQ